MHARARTLRGSRIRTFMRLARRANLCRFGCANHTPEHACARAQHAHAHAHTHIRGRTRAGG
jgi:hypothetical protein